MSGETELATLGAGKRSLDDDGATTTTTKTTKINYGPSTKKDWGFQTMVERLTGGFARRSHEHTFVSLHAKGRPPRIGVDLGIQEPPKRARFCGFL